MGRLNLVAGECLIDLIVEADGQVRANPGGGPFNAARTIARLGHAIQFLGRFSTDPFGQLLRGKLTEAGTAGRSGAAAGGRHGSRPGGINDLQPGRRRPALAARASGERRLVAVARSAGKHLTPACGELRLGWPGGSSPAHGVDRPVHGLERPAAVGEMGSRGVPGRLRRRHCGARQGAGPGGIHAYSAFPQVPLQVFFVCLVVLDPLVVVLAGFVRRAGIWLAAVVITLDMTANWIGNWPWLHADPARLARAGGGLLLITFFGLFVLLTARPCSGS